MLKFENLSNSRNKDTLKVWLLHFTLLDSKRTYKCCLHYGDTGCSYMCGKFYKINHKNLHKFILQLHDKVIRKDFMQNGTISPKTLQCTLLCIACDFKIS